MRAQTRTSLKRIISLATALGFVSPSVASLRFQNVVVHSNQESFPLAHTNQETSVFSRWLPPDQDVGDFGWITPRSLTAPDPLEAGDPRWPSSIDGAMPRGSSPAALEYGWIPVAMTVIGPSPAAAALSDPRSLVDRDLDFGSHRGSQPFGILQPGAVPAPAALWLVGAAGLIAGPRRRRS